MQRVILVQIILHIFATVQKSQQFLLQKILFLIEKFCLNMVIVGKEMKKCCFSVDWCYDSVGWHNDIRTLR